MANPAPKSDIKPFRAESVEDLLDTQKSALKTILLYFAKVARNSLDSWPPEEERIPPREIEGNFDVKRPHNVLCIDGSRGSGKTYTLLSFEHALRQLSEWRKGTIADSEKGMWSNYFDGLMKDPLRGDDFKSLKAGDRNSTELARTLKVIFPGDMEGDESVMEAIFSAMVEQIDRVEVEKRADQSTGKGSGSRMGGRPTDDNKKALQEKLRMEVAEGWYFAKHFGVDAIIRDSIDYEDLIEKYAVESRKAWGRIVKWRNFIDRYLEFHRAATLVVMLDDSDVNADLTYDILHSIRMFLNHPRIITVLAGNIRSMRNNLLHRGMSSIGPSMKALMDEDRRTAQDWRRIERKGVEEFLEKVLPPAQRCFLRSAERLPDFRKIADATLSEICAAYIASTRKDFLLTKFRLAAGYEVTKTDVPSRSDTPRLEDFLSWWVFFSRYAGALAPRSARQIAYFRDFYQERIKLQSGGARSDTELSRRRTKRLPVMLFDRPENFTLIQRFSDEDVSVAFWLRQQELKSIWTGRRMFQVNGRDAYQGGFTYDFIRYRLDVGFSMPVRKNSEEALPQELLPQVRGRQYMRRFFQPQNMPRQQRRLGVSQWINHVAIPGNCIFFSDLAALPDISLIPEKTSNTEELKTGAWEAGLAGNWIDLVDDQQNVELPLRYFTYVVCERLRKTEWVSSAALMAQLDPSDTQVKFGRGLYEHVLVQEIKSFYGRGKLDSVEWLWAKHELSDYALGAEVGQVQGDVDQVKTHIKEDKEWKDDDSPRGDKKNYYQRNAYAKRMIARYAALATDLRRAWHAILVHDNSPRIAEGEAIETPQEHERTSLAVIDNQKRMELYTRKTLLEKIRSAERPWVAGMLDCMMSKEFCAELKRAESSISPGVFSKRGVEKTFTAEVIKANDAMEKVIEEDDDYKDWMRNIRGIGRILYKGWPIHGKAERTDLGLEDSIIPEDLRLEVVTKRGLGSAKGVARGEARQAQQRNGRDARNCIWLLYGLAPSLPAVIHCHIMGLVYDLESRFDVAEFKYEGTTRKARSWAWRGKENIGGDASEPIPPEEAEELKRWKRMIGLVGQEKREQIQVELALWARLIGALSVLTRYIKMKCLHLFALLLLDSLIEDKDLRIPSSESERMQLVKLRQEVLKAWRRKEFTDDDAAVRELRRLRRELLGNEHAEEYIASKYLAIMPDVSPSTLFGDGWMAYLIEGLEKDLRDEDALRVKGVFGETEQWLWAANRCVRKLSDTIQEHWGIRDPQAPQVSEDELISRSDSIR